MLLCPSNEGSGDGTDTLGVHQEAGEYHRRRQQRHRKTHVALGLGLAASQRGLSVGFTTAALVHELMEARDERRLLNLKGWDRTLPKAKLACR